MPDKPFRDAATYWGDVLPLDSVQPLPLLSVTDDTLFPVLVMLFASLKSTHRRRLASWGGINGPLRLTGTLPLTATRPVPAGISIVLPCNVRVQVRLSASSQKSGEAPAR